MHAVRTTADCVGHRLMAGRALADRAGMTLHIHAQHVVIGVRAGVLSVCGAVAGFALQSAMSLAEAVQIQAGRRGVGIGGKTLVTPHVGGTGSIQTTQLAFAVMVAGLAGRLVQPPGASAAADSGHAAVTALTIHFRLAAGVKRIAHGPTQALRDRAGVAQVAGGAIRAAVERQLAHRVLDAGMLGVQGCRERADPGNACAWQGVGAMAGGTQDGFAALGGGRKTGRVVAQFGQC